MRFRTCQFIDGETLTDDAKCGQPTREVSAWCDHHRQIVLQRLKRVQCATGLSHSGFSTLRGVGVPNLREAVLPGSRAA